MARHLEAFREEEVAAAHHREAFQAALGEAEPPAQATLASQAEQREDLLRADLVTRVARAIPQEGEEAHLAVGAAASPPSRQEH